MLSVAAALCAALAGECPVGAIAEGDGKYEINADACGLWYLRWRMPVRRNFSGLILRCEENPVPFWNGIFTLSKAFALIRVFGSGRTRTSESSRSETFSLSGDKKSGARPDFYETARQFLFCALLHEGLKGEARRQFFFIRRLRAQCSAGHGHVKITLNIYLSRCQRNRENTPKFMRFDVAIAAHRGV